MEELVMKMKLMNRRRRSHHISSFDSLSFYSLDDSDVDTTSLSEEDGDFWWSHPPPLIQTEPEPEPVNNDCWWSRPLILHSSQTDGVVVSEVEMIKHRFSRLLLGEDMTGSGRGFSTALAISNAIVSLSRSIFGKLWRLEPLPVEKKQMWKREMEWLLSVADYIVEMTPSYKTIPNGATLEIMACNQRPDLSINLPALRKLDGMLLELLDEFSTAEFWYVEKGKSENIGTDDSSLFEEPLDKQKANWQLLVPQIPQNGLSIDSKAKLQRNRECASQILKAAMSINTDAISKMEVPKSYLESLPKTGKACLGDQFYKFIASEKFSAESVLDCLDFSAEHIVPELANRLTSAIYLWRKRIRSRLTAAEAERRELFSARAEDLLLALKHQFPHLPHATLDAIKIQCNKDVGKSILESYSGVLKSLAYNIVARIDDLLSIETQVDQSDNSALPSGILTLTQPTVSDVYPRRIRSKSSSRYPSGTHSSSKLDILHFLDKVRSQNRAPKTTSKTMIKSSKEEMKRCRSKS